MTPNNLVSANRGYAAWMIEIYQPCKTLPTIKGFLVTTKDYTLIYRDAKMETVLAIIPSQNVSNILTAEESE